MTYLEIGVIVAKNQPDKVSKIIMGVCSILVILLLPFAMMGSWGMYDIWGKIEMIEIVIFGLLVLARVALAVDLPTYYPTHLVAKTFVVILMLFLTAWFVTMVASRFNIYVPAANIIQFVGFFLMDVVGFMGVSKAIQLKNLRR